MLPKRVFEFLNNGDSVAAEVPAQPSGMRCFVRIRPLPKPGVPRDARRYLNSAWSTWEYWDFEFRRFTLREGWEEDEWNYDRYITNDARRTTFDPASFQSLLAEWLPDAELLQHISESPCPE